MATINIKEELKSLLGIGEDEQLLKILETAVVLSIDTIKSYCNFSVNEPLPYALVNIILDLGLVKYKELVYNISDEDKVVSSITDGSQSIGFKERKGFVSFEKKLEEYKSTLNRYRKMKV